MNLIKYLKLNKYLKDNGVSFGLFTIFAQDSIVTVRSFENLKKERKIFVKRTPDGTFLVL